MAIQVVGQPAPRGKSKAAHFAEAVTGIAEAGAGAYERHTQARLAQSKISEENKAIKEAYGVDLSGITDPKERMAILSQELKTKGQEKILEQRSKMIGNPLQNARQRTAKALQGEEEPIQEQAIGGMTPELAEEGGEQTGIGGQQISRQQPQEEQKMRPAYIPDEEIARIWDIDEHAGEFWRKMKADDIQKIQNEKAEIAKQNRYEEQGKTAKEKQYFKLNEPKVMELGQNLRKLETAELRYDRLEHLFQDPSKLPSPLMAAVFTKDGNINDIVYSQLTPEAQEAIKLIIDSTSDIKDTYGARITNFDLQTYLKKLPSLMNSQEGKMRVIRDLKIMNQLNQMHDKGIMDIFDNAGGTDKISFSKAEKIYRDMYGERERALKEKFISPEKESFSELPDPDKYLGRKVRDPDTGELFISDGIEWKPFKG